MVYKKYYRKYLYKGIFNWHGQSMTFHRHAHSARHAFFLFTKTIAVKADTSRYNVEVYFKSNQMDNYSIERLTITKIKKQILEEQE